MDEHVNERLTEMTIRWHTLEILRYYKGHHYKIREHAKKAAELADEAFKALNNGNLEKAKTLWLEAEVEWQKARGKPL
jgi:hypothetical protein